MTPKEYILVILSGICKSVDKTKWPEEPKEPEIASSIYADMGRQNRYDREMKDYERQKLEAFEGGALVDLWESRLAVFEIAGISKAKDEIYKSGAYPIDPSKWEVDRFFEMQDDKGQWIRQKDYPDHNAAVGAKIRVTAIIKPKENSTHVQEPTIATDSTQVEPQEPTRKLVTEELIEHVKRTHPQEPEAITLKELVIRLASEFKAKEIDNIADAFDKGVIECGIRIEASISREDTIGKEYVTQTYQPKP